MNITRYEFSTEDLSFNPFEKVGICVLWLAIQIPGNAMLFGIIQFDRLGGDPLKRRIQDQVRLKYLDLVKTIPLLQLLISDLQSDLVYVSFLAVYTWLYDSSLSESHLLELIDNFHFV